MSDPTESFRRELVQVVNSDVKSDNEAEERSRLETEYGQVWNTQELSNDFEVLGFMAPFCVVKNKETGKKGSIMFQHYPRFYFDYKED